MTYQEGDPNHIGVHNDLVTSVQDLASGMGVDVDLPPTRQLGDTGHVGDHNALQAALDKIAAEGSAGASWAQVLSAPDAVTSSYYDDKGGQWQYYEWNAAGTFSVELSGGLVWVLCVGGGDAGSGSQDVHISQGQPGLVNEGLWEFGPGTHTVTVGDRGANNTTTKNGDPSSIGEYGNQGAVAYGYGSWGRGQTSDDNSYKGYVSSITGDELQYATGFLGEDRPGRGGRNSGENNVGCVIIAVRIDVPTLPPAPPRLEVAPVVAKPVSISGPEVQEWLVRDKQNNRKVVYFLPGNTGTARSLALTDEGAEALQARRDLLDAIATTDVPEDFEGDPVTLLPKKLRGELTGFVEVRAGQQPEAVYSVTLGAGVLPGVLVGAGGMGGVAYKSTNQAGGGAGAGGVIGQGAHVPVILPVQGTATYTVTVASSTDGGQDQYRFPSAQSSAIAVQGQAPFAAAAGGGYGGGSTGQQITQAGDGASGGGAYGSGPERANGAGVPGQGHDGAISSYNGGPSVSYAGGGGGYGGSPVERNNHLGDGGAGFDLATALNLDANDGLTGTFLDLVSVDGWIAGGGAAGLSSAEATGGGGFANSGLPAKDYTGGGAGGWTSGASQPPKPGGAGAVYIITDPT